MSRLTPQDIEHVKAMLKKHDEELRAQTGTGLLGIAAEAAGLSESQLAAMVAETRIGVVPLTTGLGIISGFSDTVQAILSFVGADAFVTAATDVAGINEAMAAGVKQIFMADDLTCSLMDLQTRCTADNGIATGRGFGAALALAAKDIKGKKVVVLGAGPVGRSAVYFFLSKGAEVVLYDKNPVCLARMKDVPGVTLAADGSEALAAGNLYFEATTARDTITMADMSEDTIASAPGIPLGISDDAMKKYGQQVIQDPLELGVASMLSCLLAKAAGKALK
ncbi:MAG: 3-methylornithyl-N6-L-lysine dehydrogenase PylD [Selenomonadaceae bacterium]|nr:3-methylornithyl-N6-L-lysine dehydrogenase PylD [Selenomonadaceae bacterium]